MGSFRPRPKQHKTGLFGVVWVMVVRTLQRAETGLRGQIRWVTDGDSKVSE